MRVLHLVPGAPFGGAQRLAVDLAAEQRRGGVDASLLLLSDGPRTAASAAAADVPVTAAGTGLARVMSTRRAVQAVGADILHLHLPPPWLAPVLPRGRTVVHLHVRPTLTVHGKSARRQVDALGERLVLSRVNCAIAISAWVEAAWRDAHPGLAVPVHVVHNGVALPKAPLPLSAKRATGRAFTVAIACRLSERKGVEEFISLATAIHALAPDVCFRVAGEGPMRHDYEAIARESGLGEAMTFEGFVSDMAAFWTGVDLVAFTPPFEPFGLRLIEPVAHGIPVIAYRTESGADEVINACRGVRAVPYADAEALAREALVLKDDPAVRVTLAEAGREDVAKHFSLAAMTAGVATVYDAMLDMVE